MSISGIEAIGGFHAARRARPSRRPPAAPRRPAGAGAEFGQLLVDGLERLEGMQRPRRQPRGPGRDR